MTHARPPKPANATWIAPCLIVKDVGAAIAFYARVATIVAGPDCSKARC